MQKEALSQELMAFYQGDIVLVDGKIGEVVQLDNTNGVLVAFKDNSRSWHKPIEIVQTGGGIKTEDVYNG